MRNFWINKIDKALRVLGYGPSFINIVNNSEKESIIIEEYLFILREDDDDCGPLSLEEMAEYIVDYKRGII